MEAKTGYVQNIGVNTGKETNYNFSNRDIAESQNLTKPTKIVFSLTKKLLNKGYCIGMDNFYSSL